MTRWIHGSASQAATWRSAFDTAIGCPLKGVTIGGPDRVHPTNPGPGWTINALEPPVEAAGNTAALEVPDDMEQHLGTRGIPARGAAVDIADLPPGLRTAARARKGQDADGNPLPFRSAGAKPAGGER